jgi:AcrR family transcriptional regulator
LDERGGKIMTTENVDKPGRQVRRKQKTRGKLLAAAREVFLAKSVGDTTVTDITEAADVAYGTFYNYFKTVDDLVPVVVEELLLNHNPEVVELQKAFDDPAMRVAIGVYTLLQRVMADPAMKWLTQKPAIMADEISRLVASDAVEDIRLGVESGDFVISGDYGTLRSFLVWGITGVLHDASRNPQEAQPHLESTTLLYLRVLGVPDNKATQLVANCVSHEY